MSLFDAIKEEDIEHVKEILENNNDVDIDEKDYDDGWTALMYASFYGYIEIVELLLEKGACANKKDEWGDTALMKTVRWGKNTKIVELLIEKGAAVNATTNHDWTALMMASAGGYTKIVDILLKHGANIDEKDEDGKTALTVAENDEIKDLLLSRKS